MSTKGFHCSFHDMSQYKDQITGNVLVDARYFKNKFIDVSQYPIKSAGPWHTVTLESTYQKYSAKSVKITPDSDLLIVKDAIKNLNRTKFTVSFWCYPTGIATHDTTYKPWYYSGVQIYGKDANNYESSFSIMVDEAGGNVESYRCLFLDYNTGTNARTRFGTTSTQVVQNTWHHYALTYNGSVYKLYEDGISIISTNSTYSSPTQWDRIQCASGSTFTGTMYYDDLVLIDNQVLWSSNFTPPNYYLTGDHDINRIQRRKIILPTPKYKGDYFDKAYLY